MARVIVVFDDGTTWSHVRGVTVRVVDDATWKKLEEGEQPRYLESKHEAALEELLPENFKEGK